MHCDLKPGNVLLKSTAANRRGYICKLCDFGMSRVLDMQQATHMSTANHGVCGCLFWHSTACWPCRDPAAVLCKTCGAVSQWDHD
jgi:serine/threonine protein kinase